VFIFRGASGDLLSGFLSTGDVQAPGNYGLLDHVAALHWIADNIRSFGGDPSSVTLMGNGVGAATVNLLALSPTTRGQYRRPPSTGRAWGGHAGLDRTLK